MLPTLRTHAVFDLAALRLLKAVQARPTALHHRRQADLVVPVYQRTKNKGWKMSTPPTQYHTIYCGVGEGDNGDTESCNVEGRENLTPLSPLPGHAVEYTTQQIKASAQ